MLNPGLAVVRVVLAELNAAVSDAAANTLSDPVSGAAVVVGAAAVVVGDDVLVDELDEQADRARARPASTGTTRRNGRWRMRWASFRFEGLRSRRWWTSPTPPPARRGRA